MTVFIRALLLLFALLPRLDAQILISTNSTWFYRKGTAEPSNPAQAWRDLTFDDHLWTMGAAPFWYDDENVYSGNTQLADMRNNYTTLFLRQKFTLPSASAVGTLELKFFCDDGFVLWINNTLVTNLNKTGTTTYSSVADRTVTEPLNWLGYTLPSPTYLRAGENLVAVQALNRPITSSDFIFTMELRSVQRDSVAPTIARVTPAAGEVGELRTVTVTFSEPVEGIGFSDLLANGTPAVDMSGSGSEYTFTFAPLAEGPVAITWDEGAQINDFAAPANRFDHRGAAASWNYTIRDRVAPRVLAVNPAPEITVRSLTQVEVTFSEPVAGVDAGDLLINGSAATAFSGSEAGPYRFTFAGAAPGPVQFNWASGHGITDSSMNRNSLVESSWGYTVDPDYRTPTVTMTEVLTSYSGESGLADEDDELQDWIEIHNSSNGMVNLAGWSLSDDPDEPGKWTFPSVNLAAGARLVVFASAKDRKPAAGRLHTNFKLNSGGEFLGLFDSSAPRQLVSHLPLPEQRPNISYGLDSAGNLRYFAQPSPGSPNAGSAISGVVPEVQYSVKRGLFEAAFDLRLTNALPETQIRYTLNGSEPTASTGFIYSTPIHISSNTIVRAAAYRTGHLPSVVKTHTYLFPALVARQSAAPAGFPSQWIDTLSRVWTADYEMDPEIVNAPAYAGQIVSALKSLPVISLVTRPEDMFDNANGIYPKSQARGPSWERPASAEFIYHAEGSDEQVNCGVQMQGNSVRDPVKTPKHSFRLVFKGDYGEEKLRHRVFEDSPVREFDTLILRADFNNSFLHWDGAQRPRGQRVRDAFVKSLQREMGGLASHNRFYHLYVNGLYWGLYDATERPDNSFAAAYLGGAREEFDVVNEGQLVDGNMTAYNTMLAIDNLQNAASYQQLANYLDIPAHADYMLLHFYIGHQDWGLNKNWYTIRKRAPGEGFRYQAWDGELTLIEPGFNRVTSADTPSNLHSELLASPEYRLLFADRAHKHLFNNGALTPERAKALYGKWAAHVETAMIAESARWGDYRRDVEQYSSGPYLLYSVNDHFNTERNRLLNSWFPSRSTTLLSQLRSAGLYPATAAPVFNRQSGRVSSGTQITVTGPGTVYYTLDGSDPRVAFTGSVSSSARAYSSAISATSDFVLKARSLNGGVWSALNEAEFPVDKLGPNLAITEIMYNPAGGSPYEFIELKNFGTTRLDLSGYSFEGISFVFPPDSILLPNQVIVLASEISPSTFRARYPNLPVYGWFADSLSNGGERLSLKDKQSATVFSVTYRDANGWPAEADGTGRSLELLLDDSDPNAASSWVGSSEPFGSPGQHQNAPGPSGVRLNEILVQNNSPFRTSQQFPDWVELLNIGSTAVELGGWTLRDTSDGIFVFPIDTTLQPNEFLIVHLDSQTNSPGLHAPFGLKLDGESLMLYNSSDRRVDGITFGPQADGWSLGRNAGGNWVLNQPTKGTANSAAALGDPSLLQINEWLANPRPGAKDWLELRNPDSKPVALEGVYVATESALHQFRSPIFIAPGGFLAFTADEGGQPDSLEFKLPASGGLVTLHTTTGQEFHKVTFGPQTESVSTGRFPDGTANLIPFPRTPSPGRANVLPPTPLTAPILLAQVAPSGQVVVSINGQHGAVYEIQFSSDLVNWETTLRTNAPAASFYLTAPEGELKGFYRVIAPD